MDEFLDHLEYAKLFGYISLASIIITYITHRIFRKTNRGIKYLPGILLISIGVYNLYTVGNDLTRSAGISNLVLFMIGVGTGLIGLLFGLILGIYNKEKKLKKIKHKQKDSEVIKSDVPDQNSSPIL